MKEKVICPICGKKYNVDIDMIGKKVKCQVCKNIFDVQFESHKDTIPPTLNIQSPTEQKPKKQNSTIDRKTKIGQTTFNEAQDGLQNTVSNIAGFSIFIVALISFFSLVPILSLFGDGKVKLALIVLVSVAGWCIIHISTMVVILKLTRCYLWSNQLKYQQEQLLEIIVEKLKQ